MLYKIKSKYVFKNIFDFIKDSNLKHKIFAYSKHFQEILKISIFDYKEKYFNKKGVKFDEYFTLKSHKSFNMNTFNKNLLNENLKSFINKNNINLDSLNSYFIDYYKKNAGDFKLKILIDIYSPFFNVLTNSECLELFIIPIEMDIIQKNQLLEDYKKSLENLKNFSVKINYINEKDILLLLDIMHFEEVKELNMINIGNEKNVNYEQIFTNIFSIKNFGNKLNNLNLKIHDVWSTITNSSIFEKINNFQNLKTLELNGFKFTNKFQLNLNNLYNLSSLNLKNCANIILSESQSLKYLYLSECSIMNDKYLIKFENLETCEINYKSGEKYNTVIDFSSLKKLKFLKCQAYDFIYLTDSSILNKANLSSVATNYDKKDEIEKKMIEKIMKLKTLKEITFDIYSNVFEDIFDSKFKNSSLEKMNIGIRELHENFEYKKLIEKFENLSELNVDFNLGEEEPGYTELKIEECKNCKIDKLSISGFASQKIELICGPYSNLVKINLNEICNLINMKEIFPLFSDNCHIIFYNLKDFYYKNYDVLPEEIPFEILNNLYHNLDKVPNLKNIQINCFSKINKDFYKQFVKKLLEMKLDSIDLKIYQKDEDGDWYEEGEYTLEELRQIYQHISNDKNYSISRYVEKE